jgi:tRNA-uridine 2-sulfurtransferase
MKIVVAMSGGVDSSVAAARCLQEGHECIGLFMRHGVHAPAADGRSHGCCSVSDADDARRVAALLGIPFYALDFEEQFEGIIDDFVANYAVGRTPNPCILCNRDLKFGRLLEYADAIHADAVATGHYARIVTGPQGGPALARGRDATKDQSYVLYPLAASVLARVRLPVGNLDKGEVRRIARDLDLPVADKPESQEICFVPGGDYREVLRDRAPDGARPGDVVDVSGQVIGRHPGIRNFTIGQRHGLGVAVGRPVYVVRLDVSANRVVLGDAEDLLARGCEVSDAVWSGRSAPAVGEIVRGRVQIRYHHAASPASVTRHGERGFHVAFDEPQRAVTPGQAAVVYDDEDVLLGGGQIDRASP